MSLTRLPWHMPEMAIHAGCKTQKLNGGESKLEHVIPQEGSNF